MLTDSGTKLLDFGLAKFQDARVAGERDLADDRSLTRERSSSVTLPYMSPEQLEGKDADARSDIFSFRRHSLRDGDRTADIPTGTPPARP